MPYHRGNTNSGYGKKVKKNSTIYRILRSIKYSFFGKERLFKNFFEKHNNS